MMKYLNSITALLTMVVAEAYSSTAIWPRDIGWSLVNSDAIVVAKLEEYSAENTVGRFRVREVLFGQLKEGDSLAIVFIKSPTAESLLNVKPGESYLLHLFVSPSLGYVAVIPITVAVVADDLLLFMSTVAPDAPSDLRFKIGSSRFVVFSKQVYQQITLQVKMGDEVFPYLYEDQFKYLNELTEPYARGCNSIDKTDYWNRYSQYMESRPDVRKIMLDWNDWQDQR